MSVGRKAAFHFDQISLTLGRARLNRTNIAGWVSTGSFLHSFLPSTTIIMGVILLGDYFSCSVVGLAVTGSVSQLLERVGVCLNYAESVLLVGETGCGKTAAVQFLAKSTGGRTS